MSQNPITVTVDADIQELIPMFLQRRHADVEAFRKALTEREFSTLKLAGHTLKGAAGGYGFHEMSRMGADIEVAAESSDDAEIGRLVHELADHLQRLQVVYV